MFISEKSKQNLDLGSNLAKRNNKTCLYVLLGPEFPNCDNKDVSLASRCRNGTFHMGGLSTASRVEGRRMEERETDIYID